VTGNNIHIETIIDTFHVNGQLEFHPTVPFSGLGVRP